MTKDIVRVSSLHKYNLQKKYCKEHKVPFFSNMINCYHCHNDIWTNISEEKAKTDIVTGCPHCHTSFCE